MRFEEVGRCSAAPWAKPRFSRAAHKGKGPCLRAERRERHEVAYPGTRAGTAGWCRKAGIDRDADRCRNVPKDLRWTAMAREPDQCLALGAAYCGRCAGASLKPLEGGRMGMVV